MLTTQKGHPASDPVNRRILRGWPLPHMLRAGVVCAVSGTLPPGRPVHLCQHTSISLCPICCTGAACPTSGALTPEYPSELSTSKAVLTCAQHTLCAGAACPASGALPPGRPTNPLFHTSEGCPVGRPVNTCLTPHAVCRSCVRGVWCLAAWTAPATPSWSWP